MKDRLDGAKSPFIFAEAKNMWTFVQKMRLLTNVAERSGFVGLAQLVDIASRRVRRRETTARLEEIAR